MKSLKDSIAYPLTLIFNQSIANGVFPDLMKCAEIILLYKGKESDLVINYRSISLLTTTSKVLEKLVCTRVYKFLQKHKLLYNSQYRFKSHHSCEQAIMELVGHILQARNAGLHSAVLFLDLSQAFNMV